MKSCICTCTRAGGELGAGRRGWGVGRTSRARFLKGRQLWVILFLISDIVVILFVQ